MIGISCEILQDSEKLMPRLESCYKNLAKVFKEMHFVSISGICHE